jgi:hypothetical protein
MTRSLDGRDAVTARLTSVDVQQRKSRATYMASAWLSAPTILMHSFRLFTISGDSFNSSSRISGSEKSRV